MALRSVLCSVPLCCMVPSGHLPCLVVVCFVAAGEWVTLVKRAQAITSFPTYLSVCASYLSSRGAMKLRLCCISTCNTGTLQKLCASLLCAAAMRFLKILSHL